MKILLVMAMALATFSAEAASWIDISPDRQNLLYIEGESAKFVLRQLHYPSDPSYSLEVSVTDSNGVEVVDMPHLVGVYQSTPLAEGATGLVFQAKLKGAGGWEKVVEETELEIWANPSE